MGPELGGPVMVALFYLPLLFVTFADGACSDCAFATGVFIYSAFVMVPLFRVPELIQLFSSASLPYWARV